MFKAPPAALQVFSQSHLLSSYPAVILELKFQPLWVNHLQMYLETFITQLVQGLLRLSSFGCQFIVSKLLPSPTTSAANGPQSSAKCDGPHSTGPLSQVLRRCISARLSAMAAHTPQRLKSTLTAAPAVWTFKMDSEQPVRPNLRPISYVWIRSFQSRCFKGSITRAVEKLMNEWLQMRYAKTFSRGELVEWLKHAGVFLTDVCVSGRKNNRAKQIFVGNPISC